MAPKFLLSSGDAIAPPTESVAYWQVLTIKLSWRNLFFSLPWSSGKILPMTYYTGKWSPSFQLRTSLTCHLNSRNPCGVSWRFNWDCIGSMSPYVQISSFLSLSRVLLIPRISPHIRHPYFVITYIMLPVEPNLNVLGIEIVKKIKLRCYFGIETLGALRAMRILSLDVDEV